MKLLLSLTLLTLCVLTVTAAPPSASATTPAATTTTTPAATTTTPYAEIDANMETDPIYQEYTKKARELYVKALTDYYHAHPDRLETDLSHLTTIEYESMVPQELLDAFHIDKTKLEEQIKKNDAEAMDEADADHEEMETLAAEDDQDDQHEMEISQFFGRGRFFGRLGYGGGFYGRRLGFYGGFPFYGGYGGYGYGYPYGYYGGYYGGGWPGYGYGGYGGYGGYWGGRGFWGARRFGFGWGRRGFI